MNSASITSFTYCDKIQKLFTPNGFVSQIVRPLQELSPVSIPGNYTFSIACTISGIKYDPANYLKITFEDPDSKVLETLEQQNCNPQEQPADIKKLHTMQLEIELRNTILGRAGTYGTRIVFNDVELGFYPIEVNKVNSVKES